MNFLKFTKIYFAIAILMVGASLYFISAYGLNLGIDFEGGSLLEVEYKNARPEISVIQNSLSSIEDAKNHLGDIFNINDYPGENEILPKFQFVVDVFPIPNANDFRVAISTEEAETIKNSIEANMMQQTADAMKEPWYRIKDAISKMIERLSDEEFAQSFSSRKKTKREGFCKTYNSRNFFNILFSLVGGVRFALVKFK